MREDSYAEKVAGEAREFRHPPSPLQLEVNRILCATTILLVPLAVLLLLALALRSVDFKEAAQTATAGLITLIPEGLVLLMSVTFAVAAVRLARDGHAGPADGGDRVAGRRRHDLRRQDRNPDRRHAGAGLRRGRRAAQSPRPRTGRWRASRPSAGERNRTLQAIAESYPGAPAEGRGRGPVLLGLEVERADR